MVQQIEVGKMIKKKVKEFSILKMEVDMKVVGIMILWKEKE